MRDCLLSRSHCLRCFLLLYPDCSSRHGWAQQFRPSTVSMINGKQSSIICSWPWWYATDLVLKHPWLVLVYKGLLKTIRYMFNDILLVQEVHLSFSWMDINVNGAGIYQQTAIKESNDFWTGSRASGIPQIYKRRGPFGQNTTIHGLECFSDT